MDRMRSLKTSQKRSVLLGMAAVSLLSITVYANQAPVVSAGSDQAITLGTSATLTGTATDDGLPNPPAALSYLWSQLSGPSSINFGNAIDATTTAGFAQIGSYGIQLSCFRRRSYDHEFDDGHCEFVGNASHRTTEPCERERDAALGEQPSLHDSRRDVVTRDKSPGERSEPSRHHPTNRVRIFL